MKKEKLTKIVIAVTAVFVVGTLLFMFGGNIFSKGESVRGGDMTVMPEATGTTNEIKRSVVVEQDFINSTDTISKVGIVFTRLSYRQDIDLTIELLDGNTVLASTTMDITKVEDQHRTYVEASSQLSGMKGKRLTIRIHPVTKEDTGLVIMMNKDADSSFTFDNKTIKGTLCFTVTE